ncbi:DUF6965 family protein [Rhizosphaericola mali]|uniref:DUF6965 domain-containing protein n=1 Tax=Rhizosphaericola mali TaxID=2545455 RepID=A0A5P2GD52_9BACT|nr:hypothetical protein [Rhizosphaericola mali]QES89521.1 hypothetical protein E0W69_012900 [Rhizosphaericola mali]
MNYSSKAEWSAELTRLKQFFSTTEIPAPGEHQIDEASKIKDLKIAIQTFMTRAEDNVGNPVFQGTLYGLQKIEKYIEKYNASK